MRFSSSLASIMDSGSVKGLEVLAGALRSTKVRLSTRSRNRCILVPGDVKVNLLASVVDIGDLVGQHRATGLQLITDLGQ